MRASQAQPFLHNPPDLTGYPLAEIAFFRASPDHGRVGFVGKELALLERKPTVRTLSTTLPGPLSEMRRDRPATGKVPGDLSGKPATTQDDELSEYDLEPNDLEPFDLEHNELEPNDLEPFDPEDELPQLGLGLEDVGEPGDGRLEDNGFWTKTWTRTSTQTRLMGSEVGMATAEYAIATLAAVGLAGLLVVILRSEEVRGFLLNLIRTALSLP